MRPGGLSQSGFISESDRLVDVIDTDTRTVTSRGYTHKMIADFLQELILKARGTQDRLVNTSKGSFHVNILQTKGFQFDPITKRFTWGAEVVVRNEKGLIVEMSDGHPFMIGFFGFYEGDVPYRKSPDTLIDLIDLIEQRPPVKTDQVLSPSNQIDTRIFIPEIGQGRSSQVEPPVSTTRQTIPRNMLNSEKYMKLEQNFVDRVPKTGPSSSNLNSVMPEIVAEAQRRGVQDLIVVPSTWSEESGGSDITSNQQMIVMIQKDGNYRMSGGFTNLDKKSAQELKDFLLNCVNNFVDQKK